MAREAFIKKRFKSDSVKLIQQAALIINEYQQAGYALTLRQLYYQFVARGLIANSQKTYKTLGKIVNDARMAGLLDWDAIEDRTRYLRTASTWKNPASVIYSAANSYNIDMWARQSVVPEVWIEKDALVGVVERACEEFDVPYYACRGYSSQSEQYKAGKRIAKRRAMGQHTVILHLGDHDPSGIDMTRDNQDRLSIFAGLDVEVRRLALNMDQVEEYNPPPNPAKETDSRHESYQREYGDESWELDALDPTTINGLIEDQIRGIIDFDLWNEDQRRMEDEKALLFSVHRHWDEVEKYVGNF